MEKNNSKTSVQSQFGKSAERYVTSSWHATGYDLAKLVEIADLKGDEYVLDIATGGGHVANALAPSVKKIVAYDLTAEILQAAKTFIESNGNGNVEFIKGDAEQLSFEDLQFDVVTCRIAAHHFPNINSFVKETFRTLKKGGQFLLIDNVAPELDDFDTFYNKVEKDRDYSHYRALKKSEWLRILEEAGFEIEELRRFTKTFVFEDWTNRMNLSDQKKADLSVYMLQASKEHQDKFRIKQVGGKVHSFRAESILIKACK